jgi:hypothetical protein
LYCTHGAASFLNNNYLKESATCHHFIGLDPWKR